jgi:hypothetical protein
VYVSLIACVIVRVCMAYAGRVFFLYEQLICCVIVRVYIAHAGMHGCHVGMRSIPSDVV